MKSAIMGSGCRKGLANGESGQRRRKAQGENRKRGHGKQCECKADPTGPPLHIPLAEEGTNEPLAAPSTPWRRDIGSLGSGLNPGEDPRHTRPGAGASRASTQSLATFPCSCLVLALLTRRFEQSPSRDSITRNNAERDHVPRFSPTRQRLASPAMLSTYSSRLVPYSVGIMASGPRCQPFVPLLVATLQGDHPLNQVQM
jgi:hypothetical protein